MKTNFTVGMLLAGIALFSGCGKDDDNKPTTGALTGKVNPGNGATKAYLVTGTDTMAATPSAEGRFEMSNVRPGNYQLSFSVNAQYVSPAPATVTVKAGETTDAGTIMLFPESGVLTVRFGNDITSGYPVYSSTTANRTITTVLLNDRLQINLPVINGPGTFTTANSGLEFYYLDQFDALWSAYDPSMGSGTLTVTSYDAATKKATGTFSFVAEASSGGATGTKEGLDGQIIGVRVNE